MCQVEGSELFLLWFRVLGLGLRIPEQALHDPVERYLSHFATPLLEHQYILEGICGQSPLNPKT